MTAIIYIFLLIQLISVAYLDIKYRKISNIWPILNLVIFLLLLVFLPEQYKINWKQFSYAAIFLFLGFVLFLVKIMGGGDSKFLFSFFLLIPYYLQDQALTYLLYTTFLVAFSLLLIRGAKNIKKIYFELLVGNFDVFRVILGDKMPFAPVILLSWVWFGWNIELI